MVVFGVVHDHGSLSLRQTLDLELDGRPVVVWRINASLRRMEGGEDARATAAALAVGTAVGSG